MTFKINTVLVVSLAIFSLSQTSYAAEPASKREIAGFSSGALVGGSVGGPVGLIIGAAIGAHYGHTLEDTRRKARENQALNASYQSTHEKYEHSSEQLRRVEHLLATTTEQVNSLNAEIDQLFVERALISQLEFDVHFETDDAELIEKDLHRLRVLADLLKRLPEARVALRGHSDVRGTDEYNDTLSLDRAYAVADALSAYGVDDKRINAYALGESAPLAIDGEVDTYSRDRRVNIQIELGEPQGADDKYSVSR
ncbi:MAG: OmpA family protein [Gammaproteobacteria bacterium]|nr:OmpA family protein [Gammaproteobacteria bacterium]